MKSLLAPGRSIPQISGLIDRGSACAMRHIMTSFGSGWQGLADTGYHLVHEKVGEREWLATLMRGEETAGIMGYHLRPGGILEQGAMTLFEAHKGKGLGKAMLTDIMKVGAAKGAITFRSDPAGLSEDMVNVFKSGERGGIMTAFEEGGKTAYKSNLLTLNRQLKNIMDLGEGAAISKAGTAEVPAVLKATARIMKAAL